MMKNLIGCMLSLSMVLVLSSFVHADPEGCGKCGMMSDGMKGEKPCAGDKSMHGHFTDRLDSLNLNENQKAAIKEIQGRTKQEMLKKRPELQIAMIELQDLLKSEVVDMKAVEAKLKQQEALRTAMHLMMIKEQLEVRSKLTPEQRKQLLAMDDDECSMEHRSEHDHKGHGKTGH